MKIGICAIAKLENNYIQEWALHHLNIGFDKIIIYDNNNINDEKISDVLNDSRIIIKDYRGHKYDQAKVYNECYKQEKDLDYLTFIDIDEFFMLDQKYKNIKDFISLDKFKNFDMIKICWKTYTDNNLVCVKNNNYNLQNRFTEPLADVNNKMNRRVKVIYKTKLTYLYDMIYAHCPYYLGNDYKLNACDALGNLKEKNWNFIGGNPVWEECWINHYAFKTIEEYAKNKLSKHTKGNKDMEYYDTYIKSINNFEDFFIANKKTDEKLELLKNLGFSIS